MGGWLGLQRERSRGVSGTRVAACGGLGWPGCACSAPRGAVSDKATDADSVVLLPFFCHFSRFCFSFFKLFQEPVFLQPAIQI